MKENWERNKQPIVLEIHQINDIIHPAFPDKQVLSIEQLGTGFSNSNYKIYLEGIQQPYVIRFYRGNQDIADKEFAISELISNTVPTPQYLFVDTSGNTFNKTWAVLEWKEGELLRDVLKNGSIEDITSAALSVGNTLANIHSYTFREAGLLDKQLNISHPLRMDSNSFLAFIEQSLLHNASGQWLGEELKRELRSFCQTYASLLSLHVEAPVLVHSDFNGLNLLMQNGPTGYAVSAVIDWEFAFSGSRYADIGNILRYEDEGSLFEQHFIRGYQEHGGVLVDHWRLLSKLEDLIALCDMLNASTVDNPNRIRDLQHLITRTVQSY